ncbi:NPT2B-like protein [Mya arenaria]|uniref:NPT2B-like protein n=1 Tax=Mya arenaria TaxID=6604 RepID=A0ABY7FF69_MYAAR|nr:NPT2B-like protein [Mya arenaria]
MPIGKTESTLESVDNNWNERNDGIDNPAFADSNEAKTGDAGSEEDEEDVWKLPEFQQDYTSWSGKAAGRAFSENKILSNPVAGLMIGVLATVLLQSSSTTTSIVVSMVGGGGLLSVHLAIPIVMGANIGTSVTNTIVSIGQITNKNDFRRAFAGATVHDAFNWLSVLILLPLEVATGKFMFESVSRDDGWSDAAVGGVLLAIALALLCVCLVAIVKLLHSLLRGQMAHVIRKFINADFPGACSYFTGYLAIAVGAGLTMLVQSSSVFTSSLTPLVGIGVLSVERMYPLTLGSNIGTTVTSILAAFAQDSKNIRSSLQIALCHLLFNISGILIFFPLPFFRPPIAAAKFLGNQTAKYRWFAVMYLIFAFFLLPAAGFGLSVVSWIALAAVFIPIGVILLLVFIIKVIQRRCPTCLPVKLRNWKWLPVYCRSLEPMDRGLVCVTGNCFCCRRLGCCAALVEAGDTESDGHVAMEDTNGNRPENGTVGNTTKL